VDRHVIFDNIDNAHKPDEHTVPHGSYDPSVLLVIFGLMNPARWTFYRANLSLSSAPMSRDYSTMSAARTVASLRFSYHSANISSAPSQSSLTKANDLFYIGGRARRSFPALKQVRSRSTARYSGCLH